MAVQLFLNDKEVFIDSAQDIKVTKENPYFTLSDSYTLDVSIPLDILQNRQFFGSLNRIDTSKNYTEYSARLICDNKPVLEGTAHIVQSTDMLVKVQIASGVSALKMSAEQEGMYIDTLLADIYEGSWVGGKYLDAGPTHSSMYEGWGILVENNTMDSVVNAVDNMWATSWSYAWARSSPRLTDIVKLVVNKLGYTVDMSDLPEPCHCIYVVTAYSGSLGNKIPHWTVKEFLTQFQNFFGCTFIRNGEKSIRLVPMNDYIHNPVTTIEPADEFQVEFTGEDETKGVINRNIAFEMENSDLEIIDEEILGKAQYNQEYANMGRNRQTLW